MKNNAILLCGGIGRRMSPIPRCNKSLLRINGEINLIRIVEILYRKGIRDIVLATNPKSAMDLNLYVLELGNRYSDLNIEIVVAEDYVEGCNNVVTMRAVADYIENTYIIETDQLYIEDKLGFIQESPLNCSLLVTQKRGPEDWAIISRPDGLVTDILQENPDDGYCLAGITYFSQESALYLKTALKSYEGNDIYWEELLDPGRMRIFSLEHSEYAIEYDNISNLVNKSLMDPSDIADLVDDKNSAVRLGSMTNTTYKVHRGDKVYALRIPGYQTDRFVDHHRERFVESHVPLNIRPLSEYYSEDCVKMTEFLEGYEVLSRIEDIPSVLNTLYNLHGLPVLSEESNIDLMKEISDYEKIYRGKISDYEDYDSTKLSIKRFLTGWFSGRNREFSHRDLVPLNIMIKDGDVKLIDWEYSGMLSSYWDLASLCCEFSDEYGAPLESIVDMVVKHYPGDVLKDYLYCWIAVVDFIWAVWSLAKYVLGDPVLEYGIRRYSRSFNLIEKYM